MAPLSCLLLPLIFIACTRILLVDAGCGDIPAADPCNPTPADVCASCSDSEASLVPNPLDCGSYYVCATSSSFLIDDPILCPDGDVFSLEAGSCVPDDGSCTTYCAKPSGGDCSYTCGADGEKIADHFDCRTYYTCEAEGGDFVPGPAETCPDNTPYFSGECGTDESACCHCKPYCNANDGAGVRVEDPTDCRNYFICLVPNDKPTVMGACPANQHFDLHEQDCSSTAPCVTLCRNVVGEDGCIEPFTCQETGIFPVCKTKCVADYYRCTVVSDDYILPQTCPGGNLFNPDTLTCVTEDACPYSRM